MPDDVPRPAEPRLRRALGLRDLVLLNVSSVVALSSLAQVAQFGYAALPLFVVATATFLVPSGLMVAELGARMPAEGGLYLWTRTAFGDLHGFVAAWSYWVSTVVWLPTVALLVSVSCLYVAGGDALALAESPAYNAAVCLGVVWAVTALNVVGLDRAKWVQNVGAAATWALVVLLVVLGAAYAAEHGSAHPARLGALVPDVTDLSLVPYFAVVAFCFGGLELAPVLAGEVRDPRRTIPRAVAWSSLAIGVVYLAGTAGLLVVVPEGEVAVIEGVAQAFAVVGAGAAVPWGAVGAGLVVLSTVGLLGAWLMGNARLPFVVGLDRYLPAAVAAVHPRWGTPATALVGQAVLISVLVVGATAGSTVTEAFLVLLDMSIVLYFLPFLYLFASLAWHVARGTGTGLLPLFAGRRGGAAAVIVAGLGFGTTLVSVVVAAVPTADVASPGLFVAKVLGGAAVLLGAGLAVYHRGRRAYGGAGRPAVAEG